MTLLISDFLHSGLELIFKLDLMASPIPIDKRTKTSKTSVLSNGWLKWMKKKRAVLQIMPKMLRLNGVLTILSATGLNMLTWYSDQD